MNGSISIGNFMGIPVRLHWTFLVMFYVLLSLGQAGRGVLDTLVLLLGAFGSVFLHELGHSLVARKLGIRVLDITFWPLGGMARMSEMPEVPSIEGRVAIAGPLVNFVLVVLFGLGMLLLPAGSALEGVFGLLVAVNLLMGTFNLIPAFPMDGGRILRAWLARGTDWVTATAQAVRVGRFFALLMIVVPIAFSFRVGSFGLCAMPLIAMFVWLTGARELMSVRLRHGLNPFGDVGFGGAPFAGASAPRDATVETAPRHADDEPEAEGARRPAVWEPREEGEPFTEEYVRELEKFRGRLRRPRRES